MRDLQATCPKCGTVTTISRECAHCGGKFVGWYNEFDHDQGLECLDCKRRWSEWPCANCGHRIPVIDRLVKPVKSSGAGCLGVLALLMCTGILGILLV